MKVHSWVLWIAAVVISLASLVYQRITGPTYPVRGAAVVDAQEIKCKLPRSYDGPGDAEILLAVPGKDINGTMEYRRFRSDDAWSRQALERQGDSLIARIPHQPPAGKVMYRIYLEKAGLPSVPLTSDPVILRFRKEVPILVWVPHVILMFVAMAYSTRAGLAGMFGGAGISRLAIWTIAFLFVGGFLMGPLLQKIAFDAWWTGWPIGHDLTDNKTAAALLIWAVALWRLRKNPNARGWAVAAAIVTLLVYLIPHSVLGSELDYTQMPK